MKPQLSIHEWLAVAMIIAAAMLFTAIALLDDEPPLVTAGHSHSMSAPFLNAAISGAVENPGQYEMAPGSTISDLLALAKPLPTADLRRIKGESRLRNGRAIVIAEFPMITVHMSGAVQNPGPVTVKKGTLLQDIISAVDLHKDADTKALKGRRRLRDQENIEVPFVKNPAVVVKQ